MAEHLEVDWIDNGKGQTKARIKLRDEENTDNQESEKKISNK